MSTNISTRILRSSHSKRLQAIPWETLLHVFSYCDQLTLLAVSLVSFACWELVGPILYETVEIKTLDGLASLFFLEDVPLSDRLRSSTSLLSRIRTLILDIQSLDQTHNPFFDIPYEDENDPTSLDPEDVTLLVPHRLRLLSNTLPVSHLVLPNFTPPTEALQTFLPTQILDLLDVRTLTFLARGREFFGSRPTWFSTSVGCSPAFVLEWHNFERLVMDSIDIDFSSLDRKSELSLALVWARAHSNEEEKRGFELLFDFSSTTFTFAQMAGGYGSRSRTPRTVGILSSGGVTKELVELVDLRVVVRVKKADEDVVKEELQRDLEEWMKPLVVLESV